MRVSDGERNSPKQRSKRTSALDPGVDRQHRQSTNQAKQPARRATRGLIPAVRTAETCVVNPSASRGNRQYHRIEVDSPLPLSRALRGADCRLGQYRQGIQTRDCDEAESKPGETMRRAD